MKDIKQEITDKIIKSIEEGAMPWRCPFERTAFPVNYKTKHKYRGVNLIMLWLTTHFTGFTSNHWIGFSQAKALGGYVRRKESGTPIIVYSQYKKTVLNKTTGEEEDIIKNFFKTEYIFNLDQIEGLKINEDNPDIKPVEELENIIKNLGVVIRHQGERAYYDVTNDFINMPYKSKFTTNEEYMGTLAHELGALFW